MREWLPEDHLAWFVMEAVEELDLDPFYAAYRADGRGRAAHEPEMMVALLSYAYAIGERSSRKIETRCREDVAFRVIARAGSPTTRRSPPPAIARTHRCEDRLSSGSPRRSRAAARQPAAGVARPAPQRSWPDLGAVGSLRMMAQKLPTSCPTAFQFVNAALALVGCVAASSGAGRGAAADRRPAEPCAAGDHGHLETPSAVGNDADGSLADLGAGVVNAAPDTLGAADVERTRPAAGLRCAIVRRASASSTRASTLSLSGWLAVSPARSGARPATSR
jgi:hypothetical protein